LNNLIAVVGIILVSLVLATPLFLQIQNVYEKDDYGEGYDVVEISDSKDSKEATEEEEEAMKEAEEEEDDD
jgi:hypothetical protein